MIREAVEAGDQARILRQLALELADAIDAHPAHGLAMLSRELRDTVKELDELAAPEVSPVDEINARRQKRRGA